MSVIRLERISDDPPAYQTRQDLCHRCRGCGVGAKSIELPHLKGNLAQMEMSMHDQWRMLVNSWLKPLLMLVLMSMFCSTQSLSSVVESGLMVAAFLAGMFLCREVSTDVLVVREEPTMNSMNSTYDGRG